ncbi:uncharacterized protein LOC133799668 [Humulus lupulus]|uniref:uncharacterized protein LOC133799668 n=1 Tax=Humulus lupulus TaxID=3486 RepID=UPI002B4072F5|nr:uncharacterized protein LOC133799668 [Humulus lupulus]
MMQFARVLVEIEISEDLPKTVQFLNEKGKLMEQLLEFEWLPTQCRGCKVYGHTERMCNRKQTETWRQRGRNGEVEAKQSTMEHVPFLEDKGVTSGAIDANTQSTAAMDLSESQEISQHQGQLTNASKQVDELARNSKDRSTSEWTTPKRVGQQQVYFTESHNILSWNVRGINKREKQISLSTFCFVNKIGLGALLETKLRGDKVGKMMSSFFIGWNYYSGSASEGRILLIWQHHVVSVDVLKESDQYVHVCVKEVKSNKLFCVTFVYGRNSIEGRLPLWVDLAELSFPAIPWLVAGDFNVVFEGTDRVGGRTITALEMEDAQKWRALGLVDELRSKGSHYTWTNKQANEDIIYTKLDRIFKNEEWLDLFPQAEAVFNWEMLSDHCYCIIKPGATVNCGIKPFRFFNMWTDHGSFKDTVMQSWSKPSKGVGLDRIVRKLSTLKKSKVDWFRYGDDDTVYFHACLKQRRAYNCITSVVTESGQLIEKFDDVVAHFVTHFQKIMGSKSSASVPIQHSCFSLGHRLTLDQ